MNLIYACVFYNAEYIRLLELLLLSLRIYSTCDSFHILIITSEGFTEKIKDFSMKIGLPVKIHCLPCTSIFEAACARLHIFDWPEISAYNKILYVDTDIIIRRDLSRLFMIDIDDILYGYPSGTLQSPQFGGQFFDFSHIDPTIVGVNSGTLLFKRCPAICNLFTKIRAHIDEHVSLKKPIPAVMDQPFINYHAFTTGMCNTSILKPYVSLYEDTLLVDNAHTAMICHFSYPIGNFAHKYARMCEFFKGLLTTRGEGTLDLVGKRYIWDKGLLTFGKESVYTTWGRGTFTVIDSHTIRVVWNGHDHLMKFTEDLRSYISVRVAPSDFNCVVGSLQTL